MSYAVVFSGQGTQGPDMMPWLENVPASQVVLAAMKDAIGSDWRMGLQDAQKRSKNSFAQPLITGTALAAWAALEPALDELPKVVAGYSVGELPAYACAGVFSVQTAIDLAVQRAELMDDASVGLDTGLLSVSGLSVADVLQIQPALDCAIEIGIQHAIYAGEIPTLTSTAQLLLKLGAVCKHLDVRVASHSHWMDGAAKEFAAKLEALSFSKPNATLVLNSTGTSTRELPTLRGALSAQISAKVQWGACMDVIAEHSVACVFEIGAGNTLAKMWRQHHPSIPVRSIDEFRDVAGALQWLRMKSLRG
jgi:[acyl-carrier-protein] S-malonyltransferase